MCEIYTNLEKTLLAISIILLSTCTLWGQSGGWIETKLPQSFPSVYEYALGSTCMIFADDTSEAVYAYDINRETDDWAVLLVPGNKNWTDAVADGNAAMIFNDSIAAAYSAITHTFNAINYSGSIVTLSGNEYGCIDNFAYLVTDELFYVFDAEDSEWRSINYVSPGAEQNGGVRGKDDYIYLDLWILNEAPHTLTAYSKTTKTFDAFSMDYLLLGKDIDHGFVFYQVNESPYAAVGYSANTGSFSSKIHQNYITGHFPSDNNDIIDKQYCYLFTTSEDLGDNNRRFYIWVYNTIEGHFAESTFDYTFPGGEYEPVGAGCSGSSAFVIAKNENKGDLVECYLYYYADDSFTHFDTPLTYWGFMSLSCSGTILDGYDQDEYFIYDMENKSFDTTPVYWTEGIMPGVYVRAQGIGWSVFTYKRTDSDSMDIFCYTEEDGFQTFRTPGSGSASGAGGKEICRIIISDYPNPNKMLVFVPVTNEWYIKDVSLLDYWGGGSNYVYYKESSFSTTTIISGKTGEVFNFPSPQSSSYLYARDDVFQIYSTGGKYVCFSPGLAEWSEFEDDYTAAKDWKKYMLLNKSIPTDSGYANLVYDANNNNFCRLELSSKIYGFLRMGWACEKSALVGTANGYLFAYSPNKVVDVKNEANTVLDKPNFRLSQNYPNPFNPTTKISYSIPQASLVVLKVYNVLGELVKTLVNENRGPGRHIVNFYAQEFSSGVYFYRIQAGGFTEIRKMLLLK